MTNALALEALGDPTRRAMFEHLSQRPCAVGELAELVPVSRPAVSQHLKVLKAAGLVTEDREVAELRDYLDRFWSSAMGAFKATVHQREEERGE
jgi:DNA-binding transcriptional ArsR family regulator